MAGDQDQNPPARDPGRLGSAEHARLDALHALAPLAGRRLQVVHAFLFAAATDAELDTAAQAYEAQARQLRDLAIRRVLRAAWQVIDPLRFSPGRADPAAPLATCWTSPRQSGPLRSGPSWPRPVSTRTRPAGPRCELPHAAGRSSALA
jgi:hypothetical protein